MNILSFVEGANPFKGGLGLVGVPFIAREVAIRGHTAALIVAGRINPGRESLVCSDVGAAMRRQDGAGCFGIVVFSAWRRWAFAPGLFWHTYRYARDADFVSLHSLYSFPVLAGYLLARLHRKPYGLWPHGVLAPVQRQISSRRKMIYDWLIGRRILNQAAVLLFSAPGERVETQDLNLIPPSVVIPHGFDTGEFEQLPARGRFRARYLGGFSGPLVLFLSRLNPKKGLDLLIQAFALVVEQVPDARLAIVGGADPPDFEVKVRDWLRRAGIENRTVMTGLTVGPDRLEAFADADVFAFPSQAENFGFAMFEAMACRLPVVVSNTLDYALEIQRRHAGFVVTREPSAFAGAMIKLLIDPDLRVRMGVNGHQLTQRYSWEACGEQVERVVQCILAGMSLPMDLTLSNEA